MARGDSWDEAGLRIVRWHHNCNEAEPAQRPRTDAGGIRFDSARLSGVCFAEAGTIQRIQSVMKALVIVDLQANLFRLRIGAIPVRDG